MQKFVLVLEDFSGATEQLSSSSACISEVIPVLYTICHNLGTISSVDKTLGGMKLGLLEAVNRRLGSIETTEMYSVATICDVRSVFLVIISL